MPQTPGPPPDRHWVTSFCGQGFDSLDGADLDADGSIVVAGTFNQELRVGHGAAQLHLRGLPSAPPHDGADMYVLRLDRRGQPITGIVATSEDRVYPGAVLALDDGDVIVAGGLRGPTRFGERLVEARSQHEFAVSYVARFDRAGALRWIKLFEGTGDNFVEALAPAPDGDLYAVGRFGAEIDFGGPALRARAVAEPGGDASAYDWDVFAVRLSREGDVRWARTGGGSAQETARAAATLPDGSLVLTGSCRERARFSDPKRRVTVDCGHLAISVLVVRYAPDGALRFARCLRGPGNHPEGMAVSGLPGGEFVVAGSMSRRLRFPRPGGAVVLRSSGTDGWVARLDGDGVTRWARRLSAERPAAVQALRGLPDGSVLVAGEAEDGFDPLPEEASRFQPGRGPLFVARLDKAGALVAGRSVGQGESDPPRAPGQWYAVTELGLREDGSVWMAGVFAGSAAFPWPGGPPQHACFRDEIMLNAHDGFVLSAPALGVINPRR